MWQFEPGVNTYDDLTASRGFDYFYFLEAFDNGTNDNKVLKSSKFYTITNTAAYLKRPPGENFDEIRVVPNPYHISSRDILYGVSAPDRLMFLNIPPVCTIRIFTERFDLIETIEHTDGSGDEAGILFHPDKLLLVDCILLTLKCLMGMLSGSLRW